jgi:hypothetical protein
MDGTYGSVGSSARPRLLSRTVVAAVSLAVLALTVTGLIVFFPKAQPPDSVAVAGGESQPSRAPTTAPVALALPSPAVMSLPTTKPAASAKAVKAPTKSKALAKAKAGSGAHARSKTRTSKTLVVRRTHAPARVPTQS